jgi:hypothetical protein
MGFSSQQYRKEKQERPWKINPAWRGIGCILCLIVPIMSWVGATMILQSNLHLPIPYDLTKTVAIPFSHITQIDKLITQVNQYFVTVRFQSGQLFFTVILLFIGFGILALIYAILYKIAGPPRYGPFDVPPNSVKR